MAAHQKYKTPPEQMTILAREARARGLGFEEWWEEAVRPGRPPILTTTKKHKVPERCVIWPSDSVDCRTWRVATEDVKQAWRRAYDKLAQPSGESSFTRLAAA